MPNLQFNQFIPRLKNLKKRNLPTAYLKCLNRKNTHQLIDKILGDTALLKKIKNLKPYGAIRLKKKSAHERTLCFLRAPRGEYECFIETKSKNAQHKKIAVKIFSGGFKRGKPAWRLDGADGPLEYVGLNVKLGASKKSKGIAARQKEVKEEVAFSWEKIDHPTFLRSVLGARYQNKKGMQQTIYSPRGIPLDELTNHNIDLTNKQKNKISLQLLDAFAALHAKKYVYPDIKIDNVILFPIRPDTIQVALTDFDSITKSTSKLSPIYTPDYESPEIALCKYKNSSDHYKEEGLTLGKKWANKLIKTHSSRSLTNLYFKNRFAHDIWALGLLLYHLFYGKKVQTIPKDKRFHNMLNPNPTQRLSALEALHLWEEKTDMSAKPLIAAAKQWPASKEEDSEDESEDESAFEDLEDNGKDEDENESSFAAENERRDIQIKKRHSLPHFEQFKKNSRQESLYQRTKNRFFAYLEPYIKKPPSVIDDYRYDNKQIKYR